MKNVRGSSIELSLSAQTPNLELGCGGGSKWQQLCLIAVATKALAPILSLSAQITLNFVSVVYVLGITQK